MFPLKWHSHRAQQQPGVFVVGRGGADHNVDAWEHSVGVAVMEISLKTPVQWTNNEEGKRKDKTHTS